MNEKGLQTLRKVLQRMRDDDQDGYADVGKNGKFAGKAGFISTGLPQTTPEELDDLFELAGIKPDPIKVNGSCGQCVYGDARGGDLGWSQPCCSCSRPKMTNFVPLSGLLKRQLEISDIQAQLLENAKDCTKWWATGVVPGKHGDPEWNEMFPIAKRADEALKKREMITDTMGGRRLTNKGKLALKNHKDPSKKAA